MMTIDTQTSHFILLTAPTGTAAKNIDGLTLNSAFNIPFGDNFKSLFQVPYVLGLDLSQRHSRLRFLAVVIGLSRSRQRRRKSGNDLMETRPC